MKPEPEVIAAIIRRMDRTPYVVTTLVLDMRGNVIDREERWENAQPPKPVRKPVPAEKTATRRARRTKAEANAAAAQAMELHRAGLSLSQIASAVDADPKWVFTVIKGWDERVRKEAALKARNDGIVELHRRGLSTYAIAAQFSLSATQIKDLLKRLISVDE